MDKYLVKRSRDEASTSTGPQRKRFRQATIESLKGVVVIEDIKRYKEILKFPDQKPEYLLETMNELDKKIPSRDVLKSTKIGHTLNKLTKHSNSEVASKAKEIVNKWRTFFKEKETKPLMDVECDEETAALRNTAKRLVSGALGVGDKHSLPDSIEKETFITSKRLCNKPYKRTIKKIVFTLKNQSDLRDKVLQKEMDVPELVKTYFQNKIS